MNPTKSNISTPAGFLDTTESLCSFLHVHPNTLLRMIHAGRIPFVRLSQTKRSAYRFDREAVWKALQRH